MLSREEVRGAFVLEALFGLICKSLIVRQSGIDERYRLLETVREYGLERLKQASELSTLRRRHLEYFTHLAEEAEPHLRGPEQKEGSLPHGLQVPYFGYGGSVIISRRAFVS